MVRCDCGFDFVKARLRGRALMSYALIPDKGYKMAIRREYAIVVEKNPKKRLTLIADAASSVGTLRKCPRCGAWLLDEPLKQRRDACTVILRKQSKS
jgi:hypothetical protein